MAFKILVTAGGTKVLIDDIRNIGNSSTGAFGYEIASYFAKRGADVHILGSEEMMDKFFCDEARQGTAASIKLTPFKYFDEFRDKLWEIIAKEKPDIVMMAAAVSDFVNPDPHKGKLSSDLLEMNIKLVRAPKLIAELRELCGKHAFIVGFKMLSDSTEDELIGAAQKQNEKYRLNMTIANEKSQIQKNIHPIIMVTPEGGALSVHGSKKVVATELVDFVLMRYGVCWSKSVACDDIKPEMSDAEKSSAKNLLQTAHDMNLWEGNEGNCSLRSAHGVWISPRGVDKAQMEDGDFIHAQYVRDKNEIYYCGDKKPSIDSVVHTRLYEELPNISALLHFHDATAIVIPDAKTLFPFPCGTHEEALEILRALNKTPKSFAAHLIFHGYILGFTSDDLKNLRERYLEVKSRYENHLKEVGQLDLYPHLTLMPIFHGAQIIGVLAKNKRENYVACYLDPKFRGNNLGEKVIEELARRKLTVKAHRLCEVVKYYTDRAWKKVSEDSEFVILKAPTLRDDLYEAATVCLVEKPTGKVLLGERQRDPWRFYWAFPGGKANPGETALQTGKRETLEEISADPFPPGKPAHTLINYTATADGKLSYKVTTLIYFVEKMPKFSASAEMMPAVFDIDYALKTLQMAQGTKKVLRFVKSKI